VIEAGNFPNVRIIRAPQSIDKAKINAFEPLTKDQEKEILADLQKITEDFKSTIEAGRGDRLDTGKEDIFTGRMYPAEAAMAMGMIDAIGTRQDAIDRAGELSLTTRSTNGEANDKKTNPETGKSNIVNMNFQKISSLFGKADTEVHEELSAEEQAELQAAEQKLTEQEEKITELQGKVNALADEKAVLEASIGDKDARISELEQELAEKQAELDRKPDGHATTVISEGDEYRDGKDKQFLTSVDRQKAEMNAE